MTFGFYEYVNKASGNKTRFNILTSDKEAAPLRKDGSVQALCVIECEYDTPYEEMQEVRGTDGRVHRKLDGMMLTMRFEGEPKWSLKVGRNTVEREVDVQYSGGVY